MLEPNYPTWAMTKNLRPQSNPLAIEKVKCEIQNILKTMFTFFGYKSLDRIEEWSRMVASENYTAYEVFLACEKIVQSEDRISSYKLLKTYLGMVSTKNSPGQEKQDLDFKKAEQLKKDTAMYKEMFLEKYDKEKLTELFNQWWSGVYGSNSFLSEWGFGMDTFLPVFFQDFVKGKGDIKLAIEIGRKYAVDRRK